MIREPVWSVGMLSRAETTESLSMAPSSPREIVAFFATAPPLAKNSSLNSSAAPEVYAVSVLRMETRSQPKCESMATRAPTSPSASSGAAVR